MLFHYSRIRKFMYIFKQLSYVLNSYKNQFILHLLKVYSHTEYWLNTVKCRYNSNLKTSNVIQKWILRILLKISNNFSTKKLHWNSDIHSKGQLFILKSLSKVHEEAILHHKISCHTGTILDFTNLTKK